MAVLGREIKFEDKSRGSFDAATLKRLTRKRGEPMGLARTVGTAASILIACLGAYTSLHYLLPIVNAQQILGISQYNLAASAIDDRKTNPIKAAMLRPFEMKRSFLPKGRPIKAHFVLPEGATADLYIQHCMKAFIVEAFTCKVVGETKVSVNGAIGSKQFRFNDSRFYRFDAKLRYADGHGPTKAEAQNFRVIWKRG